MENSHYWILGHKTPVRGIVGEQCPSPFPNSALHAGLGFSFPYTIRPSPLMTTISHLDSLRTQSLLSHHKESWRKFLCPSQASLHLRVSSERGKSMDPTYSTSNSALKRSGHPTRSSHSCPGKQLLLKVVKEVMQSTFCLCKASLLTKTLTTKLSHRCSYFVMRNSQETA